MRYLALSYTVLVLLSSFAATSSADSPESVALNTGFRLKVVAEWVYVNASVRDLRTGSTLTGLQKEDFLLYEDEVLQSVGSCVPAETPFNLLLLMDVSASTGPFIQILRDSALKFSRQLGPADRIAIMTFSSGSRLILPFTNDPARVKSVLGFVAPHSTTAFYDALMSAFRTLRPLNGRKAIVVFSDGVDNQLLDANEGSQIKFPRVREVAQESDCLIYNVFLPPRSGARHPAVLKAEQQMRVLSSETGGKMYSLRKPEELPAYYAEIARDLRFIYTLAFAPEPSRSAGWRTLKVEVKGHPELSIRARTGYLKKQESEVRNPDTE